MPFDIYGFNLRDGHCEVHPQVHEPYPCSLCDREAAEEARQKRLEADYYREMELRHYEREEQR